MMAKICGMTMIAITALFATPSFATPTELDKKTVASKAYVDTKQDKIETGLVEFNGNPELMLPAITTYDSTSGLVGNRIGILDQETVASDEGTLRIYSYAYDYGSEMDNFVPTVRAVADALQDVQWFPFSWNNNVFPAAIDAYSVTFDPTSTHVNGNWPYNQQNYLVRADTFANSLALKQNKLPELDTNLVLGQAGKSVLAPTTAGNVTQVALWDADGAEPDAWDVGTYFSDATADERNAINYSIPTVGAVAVGLNQKQNKMVCAGWDSDTHTDEHCWLWSIE
ncbi:MAG: hypothetical protein IJL21_03285 [Alphaproteobacteria bacterium]|nr:hypothetical protein [Alphaproteobacteria bacterium]